MSTPSNPVAGNGTGGSSGTEKRDQVLPNVPIEETGFVLPDYDFAGNVIPPDVVGVRSGGSLGDVISAGKGIAYYSDVIGFGEGHGMTAGMPFFKLGINFFMKTGLTCSNGADMYTYFQGIPKGDSLGKSLQYTMARMGLPALRGIAPGIIEDTKAAMDIRPVLQSAFGNVYPVCDKVSFPVGDDLGRTEDPQTGDKWIKTKIDLYANGRPHQTRWVQRTKRNGEPVYVSKETWESTPKTQNADGSTKQIPTTPTEGFRNDSGKLALLVAIVLCCGAIAITYHKK
jgi:hypothetical protein